MPEILFLVGAMRSGTTWFRNLLSSNSQILSPGSELNNFWTAAGVPCGSVPRCPVAGAADATAEVRDRVSLAFDRWYRQRNRPRRLLYRSYRRLRYRNEAVFKHGEPFYLLNKSTHLLNKISFLDAVFPEARYLLVLRDPHSHSLSLKRHLERLSRRYFITYPGGGECWSFASDSAPGARYRFDDIPVYWLEHNRMALEQLEACAPDRTLLVSYRSLVTDLPRTLERVRCFLGLPSIRTRVSVDLVNNLTPDPLDEWRTGLSPEERRVLDRVLGEHVDDYRFLRERFEELP